MDAGGGGPGGFMRRIQRSDGRLWFLDKTDDYGFFNDMDTLIERESH
jgi:hypothetical protein